MKKEIIDDGKRLLLVTMRLERVGMARRALQRNALT